MTLRQIRHVFPCVILAIWAWALSSCSEPGTLDDPSQRITIRKSTGYVVPRDSLLPPESRLLDERTLKKMPAGVPQVTPTNTHTQIIQMRESIPSDTPRVCISGQDGFALPKMMKAVITSRPCGMPEEIIAKDMGSKDHNPANFSNFNKLQGLKHNGINSILEDHLGNLWFGTQGGATRYDGKFFAHFTASTGLSNNINGIAEDISNQLWFGTNNGLIMYDGTSFVHVTTENGLRAIDAMTIDDAGDIWFSTSAGGVYRFSYSPPGSHQNPSSALSANVDGPDTASYSLIHFGRNEGFIDNWIQTIYLDKKRDLWFAGGWDEGGVVRLDNADKQEGNRYRFEHFTERQGLVSSRIAGICEDQEGNLWLTGAGGACRYNGVTFEKIISKDFAEAFIQTVEKDRNGNLWFSVYESLNTGGHGVYKYTPTGMPHEAMLTYYSIEDGLSSEVVTAFLEDRSGNLWFGSQNGVNKFNGRILTHLAEIDTLPMQRSMSIAQDQRGDLWFGSVGNGILKYDGKFFSSYSKNQGVCGDYIWSILEDTRGDLWFGSLDGGVSRYTPASAGQPATFMNISSTDGLVGAVYRIYEDRSGNIWFGMHGHTLDDRPNFPAAYRYTPPENNHPGILMAFSPLNGLSAKGVFAIEEDNHGNIWFGTSSDGVIKYTPAQNGQPETFTQYRIEEGFSNARVWCIGKDYMGNLWFGTDGDGLVWSDGIHFIDITEAEGLSNNFVFSILPDDAGNMWFGTRFGLNKLSRKSIEMIAGKATSGSLMTSDLQFYSYTYEDGFLGIGCVLNAICQDRNGTIWIGATDRVTACSPEGIAIDTTPPNIQLKGIKLFNETVPWDILAQQQDSSFVLENGVRVTDVRFDDLSKWYRIPENLSLKYSNNYITFDFIGITMHQPHKVRYRYQLEGMDEHWSAITANNSAPYGNLPPGSYTFKVKAMSSTGYWSNEFRYPFTIRPPFWRTWWAYGTYGLMALFLVWRIHSFQRRRTIRIEREKTRERELLQAKEIERAYAKLEVAHEELKTTQAQLIQSEKMASLGEMTAGIAHEIQNPLNFVNNFAEVNSELLDELEQEAQKGNIDEVRSIAKDLMENEQKIAHHGKRAEAIVKSMLMHSRTSTGKKELTDLNALCDEYLRLAYHGLRAKDKSFNAEFHIDPDPTLPRISVIPQDIGRVLLNLINNAFHAVAERAQGDDDAYVPTVTVRTSRHGTYAEIRVSDNGRGIPAEIRDKIFQPFFTTKPAGSGTGLGLSISYDIVRAHGGEIQITSSEDAGTEMRIQLPL